MIEAPTIIINDELLIRKPIKSDIDERYSLGRSLEFRQMIGESVMKKVLITFTIIAVFFLSCCETEIYTVSFESNGGSK